jgi:exonuclease SbcC
MIIRSLRAENVLKYAHLALNELPEQGLIAVSGYNESGKSSIGETICFALFGRTYSLPPEELTKLIRWGETRCLVAVDFIGGDSRQYCVERSLDDAGNQGARLTADDQEEPLAHGADVVTAEIMGLAGFGYNEFIESFYLAQREIVAPHGHSAAVKSMAGLTPLEYVHAQLGEEIKTLTDHMIGAERDMADIHDDLDALGFRPDHLHSLWADLSTSGRQQADKSTRARWLRHVSEQCREGLQLLKSDAAPALKAGVNTSYQSWDAHAERLEASAEHLDQHCARRDAAASAMSESTAALKDISQHIRSQLARFADLKEHTASYRAHLAGLLDEPGSNQAQGEESLPARKARLAQQVQDAKRSRKNARVSTLVFLVLAAVLWAIWALLFQAPNAPLSAGLVGWFNANIPGWQGYGLWWLIAAGVVTVFFTLFLARGLILSERINRYQTESGSLGRRIETVREEAAGLDSLETAPLPEAVEVLRQADDEEIATQASEFAQDPSVTLLEHESLNNYRRLIESLISRTEHDIDKLRGEIADEVAELEGDARVLEDDIEQLHREIPLEQGRRHKADRLRSQMDQLQKKIDDNRRKIEVRNLARDLLDDGIQYASRRFNHDIRNLVGKTLPLMTADRYEHLQIDEALRVRVFSGEKHDFLNLDEISSGTQRQIMLAVRLALAQKLVNTAVDGAQFIILDEPFAFFDQQRMRNSLSVLPQLSDDVTQVWVIAQEIPEDANVDLQIRCEHSVTDLRMDGTGAS